MRTHVQFGLHELLYCKKSFSLDHLVLLSEGENWDRCMRETKFVPEL